MFLSVAVFFKKCLLFKEDSDNTWQQKWCLTFMDFSLKRESYKGKYSQHTCGTIENMTSLCNHLMQLPQSLQNKRHSCAWIYLQLSNAHTWSKCENSGNQFANPSLLSGNSQNTHKSQTSFQCSMPFSSCPRVGEAHSHCHHPFFL